MNPMTIAGEASWSLLCATFRLSRAAFYAEARRRRGGAGTLAPRESNVIKLPLRRGHTTELVLERMGGARSRHREGLGCTQGLGDAQA